MPRLRNALLMVALVLTAGCVEQTPGSEAEHRFGGAFTAQATQQDIEDFRKRMQKHNGDTVIMESFPPQFSVDNFGFTGCYAAHAEAKNLSYVASVNACRPVVSPSNGDQPTSTRA